MRSLLLALLFGLSACANRPVPEAPLKTVDHVDLPRYMGDWYLIASIPLKAELDGYNIMESYALEPDGTVAVKFRKRQGGFDGKLEERQFTGFVREGTGNAIWGMRIIWPFKADYRIVHLAPDYSVVLIGRQKRDHAWIMARRPEMDEGEYQRYRQIFAGMGYDIAKFRRFPQRWPEPGSALTDRPRAVREPA